jgi:hypothetical protein
MNNKLLIITSLIVVVAIVVVLGILLTNAHTNSSSSSSSTAASSTFPVSNSPSQDTYVTTTAKPVTVSNASGGNPIVVKDFEDQKGVVKNADGNQGYDILVGTTDPSAPTPPYEIDYSAKDQSFGITLNSEPLGTYRKEAEQDLMQRLGLTEVQMCNLNYYVGVANGVNDNYNAENLGFSFCPGAVQLPS